MEDGKTFGARVDGQPEKDAPVWCSAAGCAVRPAADAGSGDDGRSVRVRSVHARLRE